MPLASRRGAGDGDNDGVEDSYDLQVSGHFITWIIGRSQAGVREEGPYNVTKSNKRYAFSVTYVE